MSSRSEVDFEVMEHLARDEAFETTQNIFLGEPVAEPTLHVVDGSGIVSEPNDHDHMERAVGFPVAASVESHPVALP